MSVCSSILLGWPTFDWAKARSEYELLRVDVGIKLSVRKVTDAVTSGCVIGVAVSHVIITVAAAIIVEDGSRVSKPRPLGVRGAGTMQVRLNNLPNDTSSSLASYSIAVVTAAIACYADGSLPIVHTAVGERCWVPRVIWSTACLLHLRAPAPTLLECHPHGIVCLPGTICPVGSLSSACHSNWL